MLSEPLGAKAARPVPSFHSLQRMVSVCGEYAWHLNRQGSWTDRRGGSRSNCPFVARAQINLQELGSQRSHASSFIENNIMDGPSLELKVEKVLKTFETEKGLFTAVNNVNLTVKPGTIVALLGPSGSGKTTLLRLIAGLETVTDGRIYFDGEDVTEMSVQDRNLGMVFQSYALFRHMTLAENIAFGLNVRKLEVDKEQRVADLLDIVELPGMGNRYPSQISGGQRQRIALARALACSPRILLLDEPFGALDTLVRKSLRQSMKAIVKSLGLTTIIVTHDQEEAFDFADEVAVFNKGCIEQVGTPTEIKESPKSPFVLSFVGDTQVVSSNCQLIRRLKFNTDKPKVLFRPSDVKFSKSPGEHSTPITITDMQHLGFKIKYAIRFDDGLEFNVWCSRQEYDNNTMNFEVDDRLYVKIDHDRIMGFHPSELSVLQEW